MRIECTLCRNFGTLYAYIRLLHGKPEPFILRLSADTLEGAMFWIFPEEQNWNHRT